MKFKDRLNSIYSTENEKKLKKEIEPQIDVDNFVKDKIAEKIIKESLTSFDNIIIASSVDCDSSVLCNYIKSLVKNNNENKIIYNPDIRELVKIVENIIYGQKGYIFHSKINDYVNFVEKLKLLLLINYPNMTEITADKIMEYLGALVIFVSQEDEGNLYISNIGKMKKEKSGIVLNNIYESKKVQNKTQEIEYQEEVISNKKVNKYKLLKEKIKKHDNIDL